MYPIYKVLQSPPPLEKRPPSALCNTINFDLDSDCDAAVDELLSSPPTTAPPQRRKEKARSKKEDYLKQATKGGQKDMFQHLGVVKELIG